MHLREVAYSDYPYLVQITGTPTLRLLARGDIRCEVLRWAGDVAPSGKVRAGSNSQPGVERGCLAEDGSNAKGESCG